MNQICVVTGSRAEYGLLRPVMREIEKSEQRGTLRLQLVVTGGHLEVDDRYGLTVKEIEADGFRIDARVPLVPADDTTKAMGKAVGRGVESFTDTLDGLNPDVVLVLGDRLEVFAAAIAAVFLGKCLAHIHGGDRSRAGFDESMRHAITKLANVHFAATKLSADRIIRMGERPEHVHVTGAPGLDEILSGAVLKPEEVGRLVGIKMEPAPIVVVQHPVSTRPQDAAAEMTETLEAVTQLGRPVAVIMPNSDAGSGGAVAVIREYCNRGRITWSANQSRTCFLSLLRYAGVLVGNSSCGIIEAPSFKLPVVNVGERQAGRERAGNVIDVPARREPIADAIRKALSKEFRGSLANLTNPYGDGQASRRIVTVLEELVIDHTLLQKQIAY